MTLYLVIGGLLASIGVLMWMFRVGKRSAEADIMGEINDDARKAVVARQEIDAMPIADVRAELASRVPKPKR